MNPEPACPAGPLPRQSGLSGPAERELIRSLIQACDLAGRKVEEAAMGGRFVAVASGSGLGLASTLGARPAPGDEDLAGRMTGQDLAECCEWIFSLDPLRSSLGLAALNAACPPLPPADLESGTAQDWLLDKARGSRVALVGEFPFGPDLSAAADTLHPLELKPGAPAVNRSEWTQVLAACDLLAISGTALLTGMMAFFLSGAPRAVKVVLGPTTPMSRVLFQAGAHALAGNLVGDPGSVMAGVRENLPYKHLKRRGLEPVVWFNPSGPGAAC